MKNHYQERWDIAYTLAAMRTAITELHMRVPGKCWGNDRLGPHLRTLARVLDYAREQLERVAAR